MFLKKNMPAKAMLFIIHGHSTAPPLFCIAFSIILGPASSGTISLPNLQGFPKVFVTVNHSQQSIFMSFQKIVCFFEALPLFGSIFYPTSQPYAPKPNIFSPVLPLCL